MEGGWLASYVVLWGVVVLLGVVVLAHSRLIGLLHHRLSPSAARPLADGPELGTKLGRLSGELLGGTLWVRDFPVPRELLLIFVSPQCQTCTDLLPHVKDFARSHRDFEVVLVSVLSHRGMNRAYVDYGRLDKLLYVLGEEMADAWNVQGTPYALRVDREGVVTAKGLVNHYEHLWSLAGYAPAGRRMTETGEEELVSETGGQP